MGSILKQVSNIPLNTFDTPKKLVELKGCKFTPAVFLERKKYYFVVVTDAHRYDPPRGFYDVPGKFLTFIDSFRFVAVSDFSVTLHRCWVYEAIEGTPPIDWVPDQRKVVSRHGLLD